MQSNSTVNPITKTCGSFLQTYPGTGQGLSYLHGSLPLSLSFLNLVTTFLTRKWLYGGQQIMQEILGREGSSAFSEAFLFQAYPRGSTTKAMPEGLLGFTTVIQHLWKRYTGTMAFKPRIFNFAQYSSEKSICTEEE